MALHFKSGLIVFTFFAASCVLPSLGQAPQQTPVPAGQQLPDPQLSGSISGTVLDVTGAIVPGARVRLTRDQSPVQETLSGADGQFSFANMASGSFQLTITSAGFAPQTSSGILHSGERYTVPSIALAVATANIELQVALTQTEVAEQQIKEQEKQRVLFVPNFYV